MRRGTQSSIFFGYLLSLIRQSNKETMRQLGDKIGVAAATVSQIEKGQRALKEPKFQTWASALNVKKNDLEELWFLAQGFVPDNNHGRVFYNDQQEELTFRILKIMNLYVKNQTIKVPKIERQSPIQRSRQYSIKPYDLYRLIEKMTATERTRVQGYVEAILDESKR